MVGISGYGFYVPRFRLDRKSLAAAWGTGGLAGERAVANYDEDALTLAVEATLDCLGRGTGIPDGLLFASTSAPYAEKQIASFVATACDLPRNLWTADFAGSARAGLSAIVAAWHAVAAGRGSDVVAVAAEVRLGEPRGELEGWFGDGAAALRIGRQGLLAEIEDHVCVSEEFTHFWRLDESRFVQVASGKFSDTYGYARDLEEAIRSLLDRSKLQPRDIARLIVAAPSPRAAADLARRLKIEGKDQLVTPPFDQIGSAGVADPFFALIRALETAREGERFVLAAYGEGADALLLRATRDGAVGGILLADHIASKASLPSYEKYLKYRRLIPVEESGEPLTNILEFKELKQNVRLYGSRCAACGTVQYPMARVCIRCKARDRLEDYKLSRRGVVFTFTLDHLVPHLEHPLPMVVVDLDGGGRMYVQGTDFLEGDIRIGAPMVLTFRRLHDAGGNHNYFWKARPPR